MQFVVSVLRYYCGMNGYFPIPRLPDTVFSVPQRHMWEAIANFMMCPFHSDPQTQTATANNVGLIWSIDHNSIGFKTSHIIISQSIQRRSKAEKKKKHEESHAVPFHISRRLVSCSSICLAGWRMEATCVRARAALRNYLISFPLFVYTILCGTVDGC